jgi:DNA-directed RNA polymerase specialized sigma24 family protein
MLGTDFARTMRAAQAGEEDAFVRLWRDANPAMVRYLRVVGHEDAYDEACEGWIAVVRGLPGFAGDEMAWRAWVLACARQRAEESTLRRAWGSVTVLPGVHVEGDGEIDVDELFEPEEALNPSHRGMNDTLTALRALPLGQGEVVVLRLGAVLPWDAVADLVGVDPENIERAQQRALERLGTDAELLSWSLGAPATPAELADEKVAVGAFRKVVSRGRRQEPAKVIAIGPARSRTQARPTSPDALWAGPSAGRRSRVTGRSRVAGRSRTAVLTVAALSVSALSLGGLGAAAYVGVLPDQVQQAMHDTIGAPAPGHGGDRGAGEGATNGTGKGSRAHPVAPSTAGVGPSGASSPAAGLCRAWASDKAKGAARDRSVAFRNLSSTAGGAGKVDAYCAGVLAAKPSNGSPTASSGHPTGNASSHPSGKASSRPTGKASSHPTGKPSDKATGNRAHGTGSPTHSPKPSTSRTPNPNSPTKSAKTAKTAQPAKGRTATATSATTEPSQTAAGANAAGANAAGADARAADPRSTSKDAKAISAKR